MEMALCNLLDNALKFTAPGGEVEMGAEERDGALCLWVSDTGAGIDPQDLPHIFERFYRGRGSQGSGLGLAIVQSVVQAHGGRVSVESQPGLGSRFVIEFRRDD
jgi:signal transduction histidine kinase